MKAVLGPVRPKIFVIMLKKLDAKKPPILQPTKIRLFTILDDEDLVTLATSANM